MSEGICHWPFYCLKSEKDLACLAQGGFSSWNENKNEYSIKQEKCAISSLCIALGGNPSNSPQRRNGKVDRHLETCIIKESINLRNSARVHEQDWRHLKGRKKKKIKKKGEKIKSPFPVDGKVGWSERNCQFWWESCTQEKCNFKIHNHMMSGMLNGGKDYINLFELLIGDLVG